MRACVQCKKYRSQFSEEKKAVYEEKLEASELFKDKKALYPSRWVHAAAREFGKIRSPPVEPGSPCSLIKPS